MNTITIYRILALCFVLVLALVAGIVYYYRKTLNAKKVTAVIAALFAVVIVLFAVANWVPGKYAIKADDLQDYGSYILVQEVHYTGTGWVQAGNEDGYFSPEAYVDIDLINGDILPLMRMYNEDYANTFVCKVESKGKMKHAAFEEEIDSYEIVEWEPAK